MNRKTVGGALCPDLEFRWFSDVQHRGVKPLLQFRPGPSASGMLLHAL